MDAGLTETCRFWLHQAAEWPCTCRGAEMFLCDRCLIYSSLDAAAAAIDQRRWSVAHRAVLRAAGIDGRLVPLRDRLEPLALIEREGRMAHQGVVYACGRTLDEHRAIAADVILREEAFATGAFLRDRQLHVDDDEADIHVHQQQYTCTGCHSSFVYGLPGDDSGVAA